MPSRSLSTALLALALALAPALAPGAAPPAAASPEGGFPDLLLITIDTLRVDRISGYGYPRPTSPHLDELMAAGVRFDQARTPEPLTGPALATLITSLPPHEHGATRNGLRIREGLPSFVKILGHRGYETAAFVSNWTLRDGLSGLAEHFGSWNEVLTERRWVFFKREATAEDVNLAALDWLREHVAERGSRPYLLWVHYVEPHAPYHLHEEYVDRLDHGTSFFSANERYDTEVAAVDEQVGVLLEGVRAITGSDDAMVVFASDHGESLGDHGYWGHGRHLYEDTLAIPMSITWPGRVPAGGAIAEPALLTDLPATIFGLAGFPVPDAFQGVDWSPVIRGEAAGDPGRVTHHQTHRSSVQPTEEQIELRRRGLLAVARVAGGQKEVVRTGRGKRSVFDLAADPDELDSQAPLFSEPSAELASWLETVRAGLVRADSLPPPSLSEDDLEELRALGYLE